MTIKQLVDRLTNVVIMDPNDLTSHKMKLPRTTQISEIAILCKSKHNGNQQMKMVKFDDLFGIGGVLVNPRHGEIKLLLNLTNVAGFTLETNPESNVTNNA